MNEKGADRLLAAVEERADILLGLLQASREEDALLRARLAELEAERLELVEENRELDEQNRELEEHGRYLHKKLHERLHEKPSDAQLEPAPGSAHRRARGLSALMRHRPRAAEPSVTDASFKKAEESRAEESQVEKRQTEKGQVPSESPGGEAPSPQGLLDQWYQRYDATFFRGHTRPLKVGIHRDLAEREAWPEKLVRRALACYVNLPRYLKSVRASAERIDLDGQAAGQVDQAAADYARRKLERLQAERRDRKRTADTRKPPVDQRGGGPERGNPSKDSRADLPESGATKPSSVGEPPATLDEKLSALLAKHNGH